MAVMVLETVVQFYAHRMGWIRLTMVAGLFITPGDDFRHWLFRNVGLFFVVVVVVCLFGISSVVGMPSPEE